MRGKCLSRDDEVILKYVLFDTIANSPEIDLGNEMLDSQAEERDFVESGI